MAKRAIELLKWILFADVGRGDGFWKHFWQGLKVLLIVALLNAGLHEAHERFEWPFLDRLQRTAVREGSSGVALVLISNEDYHDIFNNKSPLKAESVVSILNAVCQFTPKVVGVDLLTGDWEEKDYKAARS